MSSKSKVGLSVVSIELTTEVFEIEFHIELLEIDWSGNRRTEVNLEFVFHIVWFLN